MTLRESIIFLRAEGLTFDKIQYVLMCSKSTISYHLSPGQKEKTRARQTSSRGAIRQWLKDEKEVNPCVDCGKYFPYFAMDFDHLPEFEKLFNLASYKEVTSSLDVVKAERAKCDLVCKICHSYRTHYRLYPGLDWEDNIFESELG